MSNGGTTSKKRSSSYFHFVAGLGSGVTSAVLLQPADLLKTRVQQSRNTTLVQTLKTISAGPNPVKQLWRGTLPSALRTGFGSALYFTTLNAFRQRVSQIPLLAAGGVSSGKNNLVTLSTTKVPVGTEVEAAVAKPVQKVTATSSTLPKLSNTGNLVTGALARTLAGFVMMPVTVLKVRYESNLYSYSSLLSATRDIGAKEGLRGFFAGFGATAVRDAPYAGLYVLFYEQSKKKLSAMVGTLHSSGARLDDSAAPPPLAASTAASINFTSGMLSSVLSTTLTNPFDAIKTRLQLMPDTYKNTIHAAKLMLGKEGVGSLFDGLGLRIARKGMSSALAWTLYEELIRRAERRFGDAA